MSGVNPKEKQQEQIKTKDEKQRQKRKKKWMQSYSKREKAKSFECKFKLGFFQSLCEDSLILKSNLELALSTILKERGSYRSRHVMLEYQSFKVRDLLPFLVSSSILVLKWWNVSPTCHHLVSWLVALYLYFILIDGRETISKFLFRTDMPWREDAFLGRKMKIQHSTFNLVSVIC